MISQTAEYALRAIVFLAERNTEPHTIQQIADTTKIPQGYLAKVMQELARRGLVNSQRGLGGGFTLAKSPESLTIYEIVDAVDPIVRIHKCPLDKPNHANGLCPLHKRIDDAAELIEQSFRNTTVADMVGSLSE